MNTSMTQCETNQSTTCCETETQPESTNVTTSRPRADIYEADDAWLLMLEMPGVDENGADVAIEKNVLTVTGKVDAFDTEGFERQFGEFSAQRFERAFRLPEDIDTTGVEANVKNGVLQLRLPKAAVALPQKVTVKAG